MNRFDGEYASPGEDDSLGDSDDGQALDEGEDGPNTFAYDSASDSDNNYAEKEVGFSDNLEQSSYELDKGNTGEIPTRITGAALPEDDTTKHIYELQQAALEENKRLTELNNGLQNHLADYFRDQKLEDLRDRDKSVTNHEQRLVKILVQVQEWQHELQSIRSYYHHNIHDMKSRLQEKEAKGREVKESFMQFKREIAKESENTRSGKKLSEKVIGDFEQQELARDKKLERVRLKNIMLRNHLLNLEKNLQEKEKLKDGLHLIDFEQLKIENQTFNEKIEERNEELLKLRKKINNTVQVLTHLKEKLQFVQVENHELKKYLEHLEGEVTSNRDTLAKMKQRRDFVRTENINLKQASGLIGSIDLLYDYEACMHELERNTTTLMQLKETHNKLLQEILKYQPQTTSKGHSLAPRSPKSPHDSPQTALRSTRIVGSPATQSRLPPI